LICGGRQLIEGGRRLFGVREECGCCLSYLPCHKNSIRSPEQGTTQRKKDMIRIFYFTHRPKHIGHSMPAIGLRKALK
jgi:hypothetical protein